MFIFYKKFECVCVCVQAYAGTNNLETKTSNFYFRLPLHDTSGKIFHHGFQTTSLKRHVHTVLTTAEKEKKRTKKIQRQMNPLCGLHPVHLDFG